MNDPISLARQLKHGQEVSYRLGFAGQTGPEWSPIKIGTAFCKQKRDSRFWKTRAE